MTLLRMRVMLAVGTLCSAGPALAEVRFAVVVGANAGWSNDRPLQHAETDAERVQAALVDVGGFAHERVVLLKDPDAADLRAQLRRLADRVRSAGDPALVVFYYSGHADEKQLHLRGLPLTWNELFATLKDLPARVRLGLVDACRSGSILRAKGGVPTAMFDVRTEEPVQGFAFLTSSGADELSQETKALQGSVFTHHFVSGLRGAADTNRDGTVTLNEVYQYSYQRTQADTAATLVPQRPAFRAELKGQGELVLGRVGARTAGVVLPKGPAQRYVVVDKQEWKLVAEGTSRSDGTVMLALRAGDYTLKRVREGSIDVAALSVGTEPVLASALNYTSQALAYGFVKGRPNASDANAVRDFARGEALRLLGDGDALGARTLFEALLKEQPDDVGARRGLARALVREAEGWDKVSDYPAELGALKSALAIEPTLSEDPDFARWYRRMVELEREVERGKTIEKVVSEEVADNPRLKKHFGLGLDLLSTRGVLVVTTDLMLFDGKLFVSLGLAPIAPGVDLSVKFVPFGWKVSPFIGGGGFFNLSRFWTTNSMGTVGVNSTAFEYGEIWSTSFHVETGIQYFGSLGFSFNGGLGIIVFPRKATGVLTVLPMPVISFSWFF